MALVELEIPAQLLARETGVEPLAHTARMPPDRMRVLLNAGVAIGILRLKRGVYGVTARGAALTAVPGLQGMILHHRTLYRDLENPVAFLRGETKTELAAFWPYVFGAGAAADPATVQTYSQLMADSQALVAADTLAVVSLSATRHLMDVGGGSGAFLTAVAATWPALKMTLFDLPAVVPAARLRFDAAILHCPPS